MGLRKLEIGRTIRDAGARWAGAWAQRRDMREATTMKGIVLALACILLTAQAIGETIDLLASPGDWQGGTDKGETKMTLGPTEDAPLAVKITTDGGAEDYPKLRLTWDEPQDWSQYMRLRSRLRVTCDDETVRRRRIAFVFYDEQTRLPEYPGNPMRQQVVEHHVPVGKWVDFRDWLLSIRRKTIRQLDVYVYENPPDAPHSFQWEIAQLELEGVGEEAIVFDTEIYDKHGIAGSPGEAVGRVGTDDGLRLEIGSGGGICRVLADDAQLGAPVGQATGLLVRDVTRESPPVMVGGSIEERDGRVRQTAEMDDLGLRIEATYQSRGECIEIAGKVSDLRGEDRAVTIYLALPLAEGLWRWWDSVAVSRTGADEQMELSYLERGMHYGLNGCHSKYPLGAVTLPERGGLSLAVRMDEPVVHRIAYNPGLRLFHIALDFGLVSEKTVDGRPLSEAPFRILVYRHDPAWGFRSALQRYYDIFPEFFANRVERQGGWYVWGDMRKTEGALEAGFGFHWGPGGSEAVKWDNENGVLALQYIEAEFYQQTMGDFDRAPTLDETLERLDKVAAGDEEELAKYEKLGYARSYVPGKWVKEHALREALQTVSRAAKASVSHDAEGQPYARPGKYSWMSESKWGIILPCNLDPDIPEGKGWFCRDVYLETGLEAMLDSGAHYDGIALDSLGGYGQSSRVNYRREHFRYANTPLSFSARDHQPIQVAAFATVEWVRALAKDMHERKLVLMANCSWHITPAWLTFVAPYLDIFGAEAPRFADPDFIRAIARTRPCTDLPYKPRPDWEVARNQLWGIFPGHGNKPEVMARFAQTFRDLASAGWEPITHARVEPEGVRIERYGAGERVYLVLHNPTQEAVEARVSVDAEALGSGQLRATRLPSKEAVPVSGNRLTVDLEAQGTTVILLAGI